MGKKKKIKKSIKSFEKQIREHEKKMLKYGGKKDYLKSYRKEEIKGFKKKKERLEKRLRKE